MKYTNKEKNFVQVDNTCVPRNHRLWYELEIDKAEEAGAIDPYKTEAELLEEHEAAITSSMEEHLNATANEKGYDSLITMLAWQNSTIQPFSSEAHQMQRMADGVWLYFLAEKQKFEQSGVLPEVEEFKSGLPSWEDYSL